MFYKMNIDLDIIANVFSIIVVVVSTAIIIGEQKNRLKVQENRMDDVEIGMKESIEEIQKIEIKITELSTKLENILVRQKELFTLLTSNKNDR